MSKSTHCKNGHEWTEENTAVRPDGRRRCRACRREWARKYLAANPEAGREAARKWRAANPEAARESRNRYNEANREKVREWYRKGARAKPLLATWKGMKSRCYNPNDPNFPNYGGRGITVCTHWRDSYQDYFADVSALPGYERRKDDRLSLDRIDNDGNYEPGNLRWATRQEQNLNRRSVKKVQAQVDYWREQAERKAA